MIVLVSVYCLCLVVLIFHRFFLYSFEILLGHMSFRLWLIEMQPFDVLFIFLCSCQNRLRMRQEFLNIVFCKVVLCISMLVPFLGIFGNVLIYFLYYE